jgi:7,8-dihydroneopterin aldolase/epimerase/oxygenase
MGLIHLEDIEFYAFHGCYKEEQIAGARFLVNLTLETNLDKASVSDNIDDALNYQTAYEIVKQEMGIKSHLLENVAGRILNSLFQRFSQLEHATLKVSKMNPPMGGAMKCVSVELSR